MFIKNIRADKRPPSLSEMRNMAKERIAEENRQQETEARINIAFGTVAEEYSTEFPEIYFPKRPCPGHGKME